MTTAFCQNDEFVIRNANYLIFTDLPVVDDDALLSAFEPFLNEINFCVYVTNGVVGELKEVNGGHAGRGDEVRTVLTTMQKKFPLKNALVVMSFGELYLLYANEILDKMGRLADAIRTGSVRLKGDAYPVEYIVFGSREK